MINKAKYGKTREPSSVTQATRASCIIDKVYPRFNCDGAENDGIFLNFLLDFQHLTCKTRLVLPKGGKSEKGSKVALIFDHMGLFKARVPWVFAFFRVPCFGRLNRGNFAKMPAIVQICLLREPKTEMSNSSGGGKYSPTQDVTRKSTFCL